MDIYRQYVDNRCLHVVLVSSPRSDPRSINSPHSPQQVHTCASGCINVSRLIKPHLVHTKMFTLIVEDFGSVFIDDLAVPPISTWPSTRLASPQM